MAGDNAQPPADAAAGTPERRSVGEILKAARHAQSLALEQIATELRIEMPQLEALEGDRFERTGTPPVFVKGYLRQYGARLGLDYRDLLAQYYKQTSPQEVQVQPSKTIKLHDERQVTVWVIAALAILVVAAGLAAWWLGGGGFDVGIGRSAAPAGTDSAKPASPSPAAAPAPAPRKATTPAGAGAPPVAEAAPSAVSTTATPGATPPSASGTPPATAAPAAGAPPPAARQAATRPGGSSPPTAAATNAGAVSTAVPLELKFEQESWAEVTDARGERLYYGLGAAGRRAELRGEPPFAIVLGNATGVKIAVDGEDFTVPTKDGPSEYARFSVDVTTD